MCGWEHVQAENMCKRAGHREGEGACAAGNMCKPKTCANAPATGGFRGVPHRQPDIARFCHRTEEQGLSSCVLLSPSSPLTPLRHSIAQDMREERRGAIALQKCARGRRGRKAAARKRGERADFVRRVVLAQSIFRRRAGKSLVNWHREWKEWELLCCVKIQALFRGHASRRATQEWVDYYKTEGLVAKVQARVRGVAVRGWRRGGGRVGYFGGVPGRPKSPVWFTWARYGRAELLEDIIQESRKREMGFSGGGGGGGRREMADRMRMADVNEDGDQVLGVAAAAGCGDVLGMLKEYVGEEAINHVNRRGFSAAHSAFAAGWDDLGYWLVDELGVDDAILDNGGKDCYEYAGEKMDKRPDMYLGDGALGSDITVVYEGHK